MGMENITRISSPTAYPNTRKAAGKQQDKLSGADADQQKIYEQQQKAAEDLKRKQQEKQEQKEREQELDMLEKQLEASKKEAEAMEDMYKAFAKCLKIASRISRGDIVPPKDMKYLAEHEPDLYKQAILLRMPNPKPKKHKSLIEDEDEKTGETQNGEIPESSESSGSDIGISETAPAEDTEAETE